MRHFDIKLFCKTDLIARDEGQIRYCPTNEILAESKPTAGVKFKRIRDLIMNLSNSNHQIGQKECRDMRV